MRKDVIGVAPQEEEEGGWWTNPTSFLPELPNCLTPIYSPTHLWGGRSYMIIYHQY